MKKGLIIMGESITNIINNIKDSDPFIKKYAVFTDKNGTINIVKIRIVEKVLIDFDSYDLNGNQTGYLNLFFHPNNRIYLDTVYCYNNYRGLGIGSKLNQISEYVLEDYSGFMIRGVYYPSQLSTDRENKIYCSQEELNIRADNFYSSAGYTKINYSDYVQNPLLFPTINKDYDFQLGEELAECIVVKRVTKVYDNSFSWYGDILIENKLLNDKVEKVMSRTIK